MLKISKKKSTTIEIKYNQKQMIQVMELTEEQFKITMVNIFKRGIWAEWIKIYKKIKMDILERQNTLSECKNTLRRLSRLETENWISEFEDNRKISQ